MTDKQIIVDDCIHLDEWKHCDICEKLIKTKDGANGKKREHLLTVGDLKCDFYPNCYYKQLKAKEQECEELKEKLRDYMDKYLHELAVGKIDIICKLKQTLTEIKEIIHFNKTNRLSGGADISIEQILQKISECEGNDELTK